MPRNVTCKVIRKKFTKAHNPTTKALAPRRPHAPQVLPWPVPARCGTACAPSVCAARAGPRRGGRLPTASRRTRAESRPAAESACLWRLLAAQAQISRALVRFFQVAQQVRAGRAAGAADRTSPGEQGYRQSRASATQTPGSGSVAASEFTPDR